MNYFAARNVILYSELGKILPAFNSAHIETILLAGAALGATVYDNIGERPMGDIDLLIPKSPHPPFAKGERGGLEKKGCVDDCLTRLGYVLDTARSDEAHYSKTLDTFTLHIDCHTDLRHYLDDRALAGVWERARKLSHRDTERTEKNILILSPEDTLIYTAVDSAIYHGRITGNTINDLTHIIRDSLTPKAFGGITVPYPDSICRDRHYNKSLNQPSPLEGEGRVRGMGGLDWDLVVKLIKSYRLETPLYLLFDLCQKEGVPIPDEVMKSLNPRKRSLEYRLYKSTLHAPLSEAMVGSTPKAAHREARSTLYDTDDLTRILRFLTRPHARWELFTNSFFPSLRFVKQCYDIVDTNGARGTGRSTLYALRSTLLYPVRALSLLWRMNKAMYQLTVRML